MRRCFRNEKPEGHGDENCGESPRRFLEEKGTRESIRELQNRFTSVQDLNLTFENYLRVDSSYSESILKLTYCRFGALSVLGIQGLEILTPYISRFLGAGSSLESWRSIPSGIYGLASPKIESSVVLSEKLVKFVWSSVRDASELVNLVRDVGSLTATTASAIASRVVDELRWFHLASSSSSAGSIAVTSCFRGSNAVVIELLWFRAVSSCYSRSIAFAVASCSSWLKAVASCSSAPHLLIATTAFASVSRLRRRPGSIAVACALSWFRRPSLLLPCVCSFLSPYQAIVKGEP
ncbi:hypothetical protein PIB30_081111 [Stylosanthes scabra]|uniref:Uncharacterized protein n=1 Tax=Stylosanthes scabra TaxID=79078 RepID=A0ABU6TTU9_9FABA|nr:hypothetical protein [Stylosanthes scabra]